jgi:hypothetical protein
MKKIILSLLIAASATMYAKAQVKFGIKGGANLSSIIGEHTPAANRSSVQYISKLGYNAGAFVNFPIKGCFSLQTELLYSLEGANNYKVISSNAEGELTSSYTFGHLNLSYIQVPVLAKFALPYKLYVLTGPQIGFLTSAKINYETGDGAYDVRSSFHPVDFAWGVGIGYKIPTGPNVDVRYNISINSIDKASDNGGRNSNLEVGLFYIFSGKNSKS